ncbi:MAG: hypothetical protein K940chlam9_00247 [Chlamydiae bacterium]|nr:hypothetical protein [Chlamydiota bacterium]
MGKKVLVAGGAGFVGSYLCEALLERGDHVWCVDPFQSGSYENIAPYRDNPHFHVLHHDLSFPLYLTVDEIYYLSPLEEKPCKKALTQLLTLAQKNQAPLLIATKEGESLSEDPLFKKYHIPIKLAPIPSPYGPRMSLKQGNPIADWILQSLQTGSPHTLPQHNTGCYILDIVDGLIRLMESPTPLSFDALPKTPTEQGYTQTLRYFQNLLPARS